jgi:predicted methyltransferase MtxX (methanogen marker protein 4)
MIKNQAVISSRWEETVIRESMLTLVGDEEDYGSEASETDVVFSSTATNQTSKQS